MSSFLFQKRYQGDSRERGREMLALNIRGDPRTHGKVDLLWVQAIRVFKNSISMAMTLLESSAPPLSTKCKNRYNKIIRNHRDLGKRR